MSGLSWFFLIAAALYWLQSRQQRQRMTLLVKHLAGTRVEKLMGSLIEGYLRVLDEKDPERRRQVWSYLDEQEQKLAKHFERFAQGFAQESATDTAVSTLALALPGSQQLLPQFSFDMRQALKLHAQAIRNACAPQGLQEPQRKDWAYTMTAELLLMQHTCHWFGRSRSVASMRLLARHQTTYEQVLASVQPSTRQAYLRLIGAAGASS